jgi:cysteine-rich secretory family protein
MIRVPALPQPHPATPLGLAAVLGLIGLALNACAWVGDQDPPPPAQPSFYRSLAAPGAALDAHAAASMISGYRHNNGLPAVTLDPNLMAMAQEQARVMAARNTLDHSAGRSFKERIKASGFDAKVAAENIGAGYYTLAEAFSGWRESPPHRANMLLREATHMGIAAAYAPGSKYKVFWSLVLAAPADAQQHAELSAPPGAPGAIRLDAGPEPH